MSFFPGASVLWTISQTRWNRQRFMFPSTADLGHLGFYGILGVAKKPCQQELSACSSVSKDRTEAGEIAHRVKALAAEPKHLSLIPQIHMEGETGSNKVSPGIHVQVPAHIQVLKRTCFYH